MKIISMCVNDSIFHVVFCQVAQEIYWVSLYIK